MRSAVARVRELGGLAEGPLPDGLASLESSLSLLETAFAWGDVASSLEHGARSAQLEAPGSPWRPVLTWALGWGHYCNGDLVLAERWLRETMTLAPPADQWIVAVAALADLSLIAGLRGNGPEQIRLAAKAVDLARARGLLDAREVGEVHTAHGLALAAQGRREEALAELEQGVLLRRLWGQPLDLADGLIALAPAVAALGDRGRAAEVLDEAQAVLAACPHPGVLPDRLAAARRVAGIAVPATAGDRAALSERELTVLRLLGGTLTEREIGRELYLSFNTVHSHVKSVYRKLGVTSRLAAVQRARDERLL